MSEFSGSAMVLVWVHSNNSGTVTLSGDYRTFSFPPEREMVDSTAGSDAGRTYEPTVWNYQMSYAGVYQSADVATDAAFKSGVKGTLTFQPEGTATGLRKWTIPAISKGAQWNYQYDQLVEVTIPLQSNGEPLQTTN